MNIKPLSRISAIALGLVSLPFLAQFSNAEIEVKEASNAEYPSDRVSFYCGTISDSETGENTPATIAYVPQRRANIAIVSWTSELAAWSPERRCDTVSSKFQVFHEDGRLNYLANGESAGEPIICAKLDTQEECSGENQLFQVKAGTSPEDVIAGLQGTLSGEIKDTVIQQSSNGGQTHVSVSKLLENAPAIDENSIVK